MTATAQASRPLRVPQSSHDRSSKAVGNVFIAVERFLKLKSALKNHKALKALDAIDAQITDRMRQHTRKQGTLPI